MSEIWRPVKGYEDLYEVSSEGRVKSLAREKTTICRWGKEITSKVNEKILKPSVKHHGYLRVTLSIKSKTKSFFVHRLVAEAFIPNPENKSQVNHKNGITNDNRVENLEWVTQSENQLHSFRVLGRTPTGLGTTMSAELRAKLEPHWIKARHRGVRPVTCNETGITYYSLHEAERQTGIKQCNISRQLKYPTRKTAGLTWRYADV